MPSIRHLEGILTPGEINLWIAKYQMDPCGEIRGDLRMAILATIMASAWSGKRKKYKPKDFMPEFGEPREMTAEEMKAAMRRAFAQAEAGGKGNGKTR